MNQTPNKSSLELLKEIPSIDELCKILEIEKYPFPTEILKKELKRLYNSKFDLIYDHKKRIDDQKRFQIINSLEDKSKEKYSTGDFKGAIKALRRSEKYQ